LPDDGYPALSYPGQPRTSQFAYRENGLLNTITTPEGYIITHGYDKAGRLHKRDVDASGTAGLPVGETKTQRYRYDGKGRCILAVDEPPSGASDAIAVEQVWDSADNLCFDTVEQTVLSGPARIKASADYNSFGELNHVNYPLSSFAQRHIFDPQNRIVEVSGLASYHYDNNLLLRRNYHPSSLALDVMHDADGSLDAYLHDDLNPIGGIVRTVGGETVRASDELAQPTIVQDGVSGTGRYYEYDSIRRTSATYGNITLPPGGGSVTLPMKKNTGSWVTYDAGGNTFNIRGGTIANISGTTLFVEANRYTVRTVNKANQILQSIEEVNPASNVVFTSYGRLIWKVTGSTSAIRTDRFRYDPRGNLIEDPNWTYAYDVFNRLTGMTNKSSGQQHTFRYDGHGRRIIKNHQRFVYHGRRLLEESPESANWIKRFLHGAEGVLAFDLIDGGTTTRRFLHEDHAGTVLFVSDSSGSPIETYSYDAFGTPSAINAAGSPTAFHERANLLLHQGQYYDFETNLYLVGSRYYHPSLQRMLQQDAGGIDSGANSYMYDGNNLQTFSDESGNVAVLVVLAAMAIGALIGAAVGFGLDLLRQLVGLMSGEQDSFDGRELLIATGLGALAGTLAAIPGVGPHLAIIGAELGLTSAYVEYRIGNYALALFDLAATALVLVPMARSPRFRARLANFSAVAREAYQGGRLWQSRWRLWAEFTGPRDAAIRRIRLRDITGHYPGFPHPELPFRFAVEARRAPRMQKMLEHPIELNIDVPWLEESGCYGNARAHIPNAGQNRTLMAMMLLGEGATLGQLEREGLWLGVRYWNEVPLRHSSAWLEFPFTMEQHMNALRQWDSVGNARFGEPDYSQLDAPLEAWRQRYAGEIQTRNLSDL